jgi:hypothetical protein
MPLNDTKQISPLMTRRIRWFAMLQGLLLICGIFLYTGIKSPHAPPANFELIKYIFLLLSVTAVLSSKQIKDMINKSSTSHSTQHPKGIGSRSHLGFFVVMAICEGSALIGLMLAFLSGNMNNIYLLAAPGVIGMAFNFPQEE